MPEETLDPPTKDAYVDEVSDDTNYGSSDYIQVYSYVGYRQRGFIEFDISSIPAGAIITSVILKLYCSSFDGARTMRFYRITGSWTEGEVTWNNQPTIDETKYVDHVLNATGWREIDVTDLFVLGSTFGLQIRDKDEGSTGKMQKFYSKDYGGYNPKLIVTYIVPLAGGMMNGFFISG